MKFTPEQTAFLKAPLSQGNVKSRDQGGRKVSYVEGWHAIAEANRIFGFDAWSRETVDLKCVAEKPREIGQAKTPGFGVTYIARVRVTVGEIIREGCGTGHGIDRDCGQAHESALKEAETDAMKRALMTFGNPFGLALYDKTQANVAPEADESVTRFIATCEETIVKATDPAVLHAWWMSEEQKKQRRDFQLDTDTVARLKAMTLNKIEALKPKKAA